MGKELLRKVWQRDGVEGRWSVRPQIGGLECQTEKPGLIVWAARSPRRW